VPLFVAAQAVGAICALETALAPRPATGIGRASEGSSSS
jgi:hypothetical protein